MIPTIKNGLYTAWSKVRNNYVGILCVILACSILAVPAAAQLGSFSDNFEDQSTAGWQAIESSQYPEIINEGTEGNYSLFTDNTQTGGEGDIRWVGGPNLNLQTEFQANFVVRSTFPDNNGRIRYGIGSDSVTTEGENAFIIVDRNTQETYLGSSVNSDPGSDVINDDFNDEWVNVELYSADNNNTVQAKVWSSGTSEPSEYQLSADFSGATNGSFYIATGSEQSGSGDRRVSLDQITIQGQTVQGSDLRVDTRNFIRHGDTAEYTVYDDVSGTEVTNDAAVSSQNTSVVTVDTANNQLVATNQTNINNRVNVTYTYNGRTLVREVTVASPTIDNLEILPSFWRFAALFLDRGFQMIIAGLLLAIGATRFSSSFGGIAVFQMSLTAGWLIGWVSIGLAMVSLFASLFIGLNLAANIDYTVRR